MELSSPRPAPSGWEMKPALPFPCQDQPVLLCSPSGGEGDGSSFTGFAGGTWHTRSPTRETPTGVGLGSPPALEGARAGRHQTHQENVSEGGEGNVNRSPRRRVVSSACSVKLFL